MKLTMAAAAVPRRKFETNEEMLARIMSFGCPTGALIQPFVMQALDVYCRMVASIESADLDSPLLSGEAWKRTGAWLQEELNKHFNQAL